MKTAVILCGCGRADGSEITEAVSALIHLSRVGAQVRCFAPDAPQREVVNHLTGKLTPGETRNQLVEAARIARGKIEPLATLNPADFDAIVFPGGFGAAKNLCTFAFEGDACSVIPDVTRVVTQAHAKGTPLGFICIAPVIGAKVLGKAGGATGSQCLTLTIGTDEGTAKALATMGAQNVPLPTGKAHADSTHKVVSTPAYMHDGATPFEVFTGIGALVDELVAMTRTQASRHAGRTVHA